MWPCSAKIMIPNVAADRIRRCRTLRGIDYPLHEYVAILGHPDQLLSGILLNRDKISPQGAQRPIADWRLVGCGYETH